jgi:DNA-binding NarL/FixJ family response regulator
MGVTGARVGRGVGAGPAGRPWSRLRAGPVLLRSVRCHARDVAARVLIVDDHAPFRSLARRLLAAGGFQVVGEAADGADALTAAHDLAPDVVVLDVHLPDADGFTVAEQLIGRYGALIVVLVSSRARRDYGSRVDTSPAAGFIAKAELSGDALRGVISGVAGAGPCGG